MRNNVRGHAKNWASGLIGIAGLLMVITAQAATPRAPVLCLDAASNCASAPGASSYPWYPALDLNQIPFHAGAGAWGPQLAIQAPAAPVITSSANVANASQLQACMAVAGRRCTITANIDGFGINGNVTDVEVVVPNGIVVKNATWSSGGTKTRLRFTKAPGDTIGGQMHGMDFVGGTTTDLIIDGLQFSASNAGLCIFFGGNTPPNRVAIVNNRFRSNNAVFGYGAQNLVVAGNSAQHDANNIIEGGDWGFRMGDGPGTYGPYVFFQNDIRGGNYAPIRFHTAPVNVTPYYVWVGYNNFVSREGRFVEEHAIPGNEHYPPLTGSWLINNTAYMPGSFGMASNRAGVYSRIVNTTIYGATAPLTTGTSIDASIIGTIHNVINPGAPAWGGAGDPSGINLNP
jgi:hypothetical protein